MATIHEADTEAGSAEVAVTPVLAAPDPRASLRRTLALVADLTRAAGSGSSGARMVTGRQVG